MPEHDLFLTQLVFAAEHSVTVSQHKINIQNLNLKKMLSVQLIYGLQKCIMPTLSLVM